MDGAAQTLLDDISFTASMQRRDAVGILYVEDFDAVPEPPPPPPPPEATAPVFAEEDMAAARLAGRAEGMQAALSDAAVLQAQLQVAATQALADALNTSRAALERIATERASSVARLMLAVLQAALPALMSSHAGGEADAMLKALLPGLRCEPHLRVRAHPDFADGLRECLISLLPPEGTVLSVAADPTFQPGDVHVAWEDGGAARNCAAIWQSVRESLASLDLPLLEEICRAQRQ